MYAPFGQSELWSESQDTWTHPQLHHSLLRFPTKMLILSGLQFPDLTMTSKHQASSWKLSHGCVSCSPLAWGGKVALSASWAHAPALKPQGNLAWKGLHSLEMIKSLCVYMRSAVA